MTPRARGFGYRPSFGVSGDFLDFVDEQEAIAMAAKAKRDAGNFAPYFVRRAAAFGSPFQRWTVYREHIDLNSAAPEYTSLPRFMSFAKACRVAYHLQQAEQRV